MQVRFSSVSFEYETSREPLFHSLDLHLSRGWTGVVGPNGVGKTTLLRIAADGLSPTDGGVSADGLAIYCPQRTDEEPQSFEAFLKAPESASIRGTLNVKDHWSGQWSLLSHGERKRIQIGVALWRNPDILAVDEPANHLDQEARALLFRALTRFNGVGLLVSHDRKLLDSLCDQCLFMHPTSPTLRPGGFSEGEAAAKIEREHAQHLYQSVRQNRMRLEKEAAKRKDRARGAKKQLSKRGIAAKDRDRKSRVDAARLSGKDARAGALQKQLDNRLERIRAHEADLRGEKTYQSGIWLPGNKLKGNHLFHLEPGNLNLDGSRTLSWPGLAMACDDRIGMQGPNGSGKSTLIRHILENGGLRQGMKILYIPQEIQATQGAALLQDTRRLSGESLGRVMTTISRLGSDPSRLLKSAFPSPGETRKLLLALGISKDPNLIIMDEPGNHLDLVSKRCLEEALADCPCGLLIVAHDATFLEKTTRITWRFEKADESRIQLRIS